MEMILGFRSPHGNTTFRPSGENSPAFIYCQSAAEEKGIAEFLLNYFPEREYVFCGVLAISTGFLDGKSWFLAL